MDTSFLYLLSVIYYFALCVLCAVAGAEKKTGWIFILIISIFFSPIIGFLMVISDKDKQTDLYEKEVLEYLKNNKK